MNPQWINLALQIISALIVLIVLYIITLMILNIDVLVARKTLEIKQKESTLLVDGYASPAFLQEINYNTVNPFVNGYKRIAKSANHLGGASFTYQFWIRIEDANDELFKNLIILLKGDKTKYQLGYYEKNGSEHVLRKKLDSDILIACPMIKFGNNYRDIRIRFNSNNEVVNEYAIVMNPDGDPTSRKNFLSLLPNNWMLLTFVFEDNYSTTEGIVNGIKLTMYINDMPYWSETASSLPNKLKGDTFKQNDGNFFMFPNVKTASDFVKLGNVRYYNYPVTQQEVTNVYSQGAPTHSAKKDFKDSPPSYISALNKIDVTNY